MQIVYAAGGGGTKFVIKMGNLTFENFYQLLPKFHLLGISFLLEMGLFADHDESSKKAIDGAKDLEVSCKETAAMNTKMSSAERQRISENLNQKTTHRSIDFMLEQISTTVWMQIMFNRLQHIIELIVF